MHPRERGREVHRARVCELQQAPLGAGESVSRRWIFLKQPFERRCQEWQRRGIGAAQVVQRLGRRLAECPPGTLCQRVLRLGDALPRFEQRRQFIRRELTESLETGAARKRSHAHEADGLLRRNAIPNPAQNLNQVQLIEQIVLEPQDQFVVGVVVFDDRAPAPEVVDGIRRRFRSRASEITRPDLDELGIAHAAGNRALVEWVRPDRHGAWNSCRLDRPRRRGTVRDVQKALGRSARYRGRGVEAGFSLTWHPPIFGLFAGLSKPGGE